MQTVSPPGYLWRELLLDVGSKGKGSHEVRSQDPACWQVPDVKGEFQKVDCVQGMGLGGFTAYLSTSWPTDLGKLLVLAEPPFLHV